MGRLRLASCMAENSEPLCQAIAAYISVRLNIATEYVTGIPWQQREARFDRGDIHILWLCGLPYVDKADRGECGMELLAAPVPAGARYQSKPIYFSDVIVRRDSPALGFNDLRGADWAYNEPRSHSGYNVVRSYLAARGAESGFFGRVVESGAHTQSLNLLLSGIVDGAAIDSTVLEWLYCRRGALAEQIRVIETLGPSPIPPWVVSRSVCASQRRELRGLLADMHEDALGQAILARSRLERFVAAEDRDYDPIRAMARQAETVSMI